MANAEPQLVMVVWEDASSGNHEWVDLDTVPDEPEPLMIRTVGYLIRQNRKRIMVAGSYSVKPDGTETVVDLFTIPRGMIHDIVHLKGRYRAATR